jgi:hypothetical protein
MAEFDSKTNFFEFSPEEDLTLSNLRKEIPAEFIKRDRDIKEALKLVPEKFGRLKIGVPYATDYLVANIFDLRMGEGLKKIFDKFTSWNQAGGMITFSELSAPTNEELFKEFPLIFPPKRVEPELKMPGQPEKQEKQKRRNPNSQKLKKENEADGSYPNLNKYESGLFDYLLVAFPNNEFTIQQVKYPESQARGHRYMYQHLSYLIKTGYLEDGPTLRDIHYFYKVKNTKHENRS